MIGPANNARAGGEILDAGDKKRIGIGKFIVEKQNQKD